MRLDNEISSDVFSDGQPMSESRYLSLGETPDRIELLDGTLVVAVWPSPWHQHILGEVLAALHGPARHAGLHALHVINLRLGPDRIANPDLVVAAIHDLSVLVADASAVRLIGEIVVPSTSVIDRILKMHLYAEAGIPWYLLVEHEAATLHLFELVGGKYKEHSVTEVGQTLTLTEPVSAVIDPRKLLPPN